MLTISARPGGPPSKIPRKSGRTNFHYEFLTEVLLLSAFFAPRTPTGSGFQGWVGHSHLRKGIDASMIRLSSADHEPEALNPKEVLIVHVHVATTYLQAALPVADSHPLDVGVAVERLSRGGQTMATPITMGGRRVKQTSVLLLHSHPLDVRVAVKVLSRGSQAHGDAHHYGRPESEADVCIIITVLLR